MKILGNLIAAILACLFALVLLEFAVRYLDLVAPPVESDAGLNELIEFDKDLEFVYRPNADVAIASPYGEFETQYKTNALGLRDDPINKDPNAHNILVLGNSFVEGWGAEKDLTLVKHMERALNSGKSSADTITLIPAGLSGYGAAQASILAHRLFDKTQSQGIVFVLVGTMLHADADFLTRARLNSQGIAQGLSADAVLSGGQKSSPKTKASWFDSTLAAASEYSDLALLIKQRLDNAQAIEDIDAGNPLTDLLAAYRMDQSDLVQNYERTFAHVSDIAALAASENVPFTLLHIPAPHEVTDKGWLVGREAYGLEPRIYDTPEEGVVKAFCAEQNLECVFSKEYLRALSKSENAQGNTLYYDYDFHFNPLGNENLGTWLGERLKAPLNSVTAD
jgi:hypothetical protein